MSTSSNTNIEQLAVEDLQPGMYVVALYETAETKIKIRSEGYVRSEEMIEQLQNSGVQYVAVDPSKQKAAETIDKVLTEDSVPKKEESFSKQIKKSKDIIDDAKKIQQEFLNSIKIKDKIEIQTAEAITLSIVTTVFRHQDALLCVSSLRNKNSYLMEHAVKTSVLMTLFAKHLNFDDKTVHQLALGAFLHDIGKIYIADNIINKPGKLTLMSLNN